VGLCLVCIALLAFAGGFPPWAWRFLFQAMSRLPALWVQRGPAIVLPFVGLLLLALTLFVLWGLILLVAALMVRDWLQRRRDMHEFAQDLARAEATRSALPAGKPSPVSPVPPKAPIPTSVGAREAVGMRAEPFWSSAPGETAMQPGRANGRGAAGRAPTMPVAVAYASDDLPASSVSLDVGTALDPGIKRKGQPNEDSLLAIPSLRASRRSVQSQALFVVADGMGGHGNGQEASRLAIASLHDSLRLALLDGVVDAGDDIYEELLAEAVHNANLAIFQRNRQKQADMGTTLTAVLIVGNTAYIANVGDSRTYLYRPGEGLSQITRDHSAVARLVEVGAITPREVYTHPKRNEIYRSLGQAPAVKVDTRSLPLKVGDLLLLCSDGLWEMVYDSDIEKTIGSWLPSPAHICDALLQAALRAGGKDNIGIIAVRVKRN
jgi:serine/threonine protein phosphatase PrpC